MHRANTVENYLNSAGQWSCELEQLRKILLASGLDEEIKWGMPCYTSNSKNIVSMVGFKAYFGLWFHQGASLQDTDRVLINAQEGKTKALRQWRMTSLKDIQKTVIRRYVKEATALAGPVQMI